MEELNYIPAIDITEETTAERLSNIFGRKKCCN